MNLVKFGLKYRWFYSNITHEKHVFIKYFKYLCIKYIFFVGRIKQFGGQRV